MERRRTRGEAEIEALLTKLSPGSPRFKVLAAARDFKASWVELGERLTEVREDEGYRAWGYTAFDAYCRRELRLKPETANKLTRSFSFLRDHEPKALKQREVRELPPLDVVDMLSVAREKTKVSDRDLSSIQEEVFSTGTPPTKQQVLKRFREVDPEAFKSAPRPAKEGKGGDGELRKTLLLGERLQSLLEVIPGISRNSLSAARGIVAELRERFEQTEQKSA